MDPIELRPLPPREAIAFFQSKGLAPALQRFDWRDHWREEHAKSFVVAKAMRDDVLETIRDELADALNEGRTLEQFRADLTPKLQQFGWWGRQIDRDPVTGELVDVQLGSRHRLRTIFDTNMRTSYAAGKWARIQRTKAAFPYLEYVQLERDTKRKEHEPYNGIIRPVDDPIWLQIFPPNGFFCGCYVRQVNDRMLKREGKSVSPPIDLDREQITNPRSGVVDNVPVGIHPGFDSNPGATWLDLKDKHDQSVLDLPRTHIATDRGLTQQIRATGIRDDFESLVIYDLERPADRSYVGLSRADPSEQGRRSVRATPLQLEAMVDPDRRVVAIHNHPSSSSFSTQDIVTFSRARGLAQLVAVGHDGSIYRVSRTDLTSEIDGNLPGAILSAALELIRANRPAIRSDLELGPLVTHISLMTMQRLDLLQYAAATSGRNRDAFDRNAALIEEVIAQILDALE